MRGIGLCLAAAVTLALAPAARAQEVPSGPSLIVITPATPPPRFDNLRFGLAHFSAGGIPQLFPSGAAVSLGFDYRLGGGLAVALDTFNLYHDYGSSTYLLSLNPVQLRYRLGIPMNAGWPVAPFLTAGTGIAAMTLLGDGAPRLGLGIAASTGLGAIIAENWTAEIGLNLGQVAEIGYAAWQIRLGTGFSSLGSFGRFADKPPRAALAPLAGSVEAVAGDRLTLALESGAASPGSEVLVYYEDGVTIKVARARLEAVAGEKRAIARVLVATEPVKPGYRIRAW